MAAITGASNDKIFSVAKWYGLNEHPDGDTRLRMGEASKMINWRITRDGNLKLRPGQEFMFALGITYVPQIGSQLRDIGVYSANDTIYLANAVSSTAVPGKIILVGGAAALADKGVLMTDDATILSGVMRLPDSAWEMNEYVPGTVDEWDTLINNAAAGEMVTASQVPDILDALLPGEYKYVEYDGAVYALVAGGMTVQGGQYYMHGYPVTAEAAQTPSPVVSMWSGVMNGHDVFLAACNDMVYGLYDYTTDRFRRSDLMSIDTSKGVHFFQFDGIVYILNGSGYYKYDGSTFVEITADNAYVPLVAIGIGPTTSADAGELTGENVNLLTNKRRVWISPNGTANPTFQLPEKGLKSIDYVRNTSSGADTSYSWTPNTANGTVTINTTVPTGVNTYEIGYSVHVHDSGHPSIPDYHAQVASMRFSELYSGTTDTRIFLYGDGSNKTIYSGMDYDGMPRADYFPDQYEVLVGDANTPITSMVRHYGALIAFKPTECWALQHGVAELATGDLTPSIYCTPVNRERGSAAPGQVALVNNSPVTVSGTELYQWTNSSYYTSNLTRDERQAKRISDRIQKSIKEIDFKTCLLWDDNDNQEFYLVGNNMALVWNYAVDAWYRYNDFDCTAICSFHGDLYVGSHDGKIRRVSDYVRGDDGFPIEARWESGAMDFGAPNSRKYSAALWIGMKPEDDTWVDVTVITDRKNTFAEKRLSSEKAKIPGQPFMTRTKLKAKKFVFYRLILSVHDKMLPVTVTNAEIRVRMTSEAK